MTAQVGILIFVCMVATMLIAFIIFGLIKACARPTPPIPTDNVQNEDELDVEWKFYRKIPF